MDLIRCCRCFLHCEANFIEMHIQAFQAGWRVILKQALRLDMVVPTLAVTCQWTGWQH
jgi:hypothetical protein